MVSVSQPKPLQLRPPGSGLTSNVSTTATVHLRFDPVGDEQPPKLGSLCSKLGVSTFYTVSLWADFQTPSYVDSLGRHHYTKTVSLSSLCDASTRWAERSATSVSSLRGLTSTESLFSASTTFKSDAYYQLLLLFPSPYRTKAFVPTFHSCLMSQIYILDLNLSYHTRKPNLLAPSISPRLPVVQITSRGRSQSFTYPPLYTERDTICDSTTTEGVKKLRQPQ